MSSTKNDSTVSVLDPLVVQVPDVLSKIIFDQALIGQNAQRLKETIAKHEAQFDGKRRRSKFRR